MSELTAEDIRRLIDQHFRDCLREYEEDAVERTRRVDEHELEEQLRLVDTFTADKKEALALCDYTWVRQQFHQFLEDRGITLERKSELYRMAIREWLKSEIELSDIWKHRALGDFIFEHNNPRLKNVQPAAPLEVPEEEPSMLLSELVRQYTEEQQRAGNWTVKTQEEFLAIMKLLQDLIGDVPVKSISHRTMQDVKQALLRLPANMNRVQQYRGKTVQEILEMDVEKPLSTTSVNKYMNRASSLFKFAEKNEWMDKNPAEGKQIKQSKRQDELRAAFSKEDLDKLFWGEEYLEDAHRSPYAFWMPVLALYTGCRLEELAQLHLDDIRQEDGVWVIDINNQGAKKVKTRAALRLVPLHPFLLDEVKLVQYAQHLKQDGHQRLFPELAPRRDGYGQTVSKWFARYRERCGVKDTEVKKDFHSFRHTFIDTLKQTYAVESVMLAELVGHEVPGMTMGRYGKRYAPRVLLEQAIMKLNFGVDLGPLKKSRYVGQDG